MRSIGFGLERLGLAASRAPLVTRVLLAVVTLLALAGLPRLQFDDDVVRTFRSASATYRDYEALERELGTALTPIVIIASRPTPLTAADLKLLRELHYELEFIDGVEAVASLFGLRELGPGLEPGAPLVPDQFGDDDIPKIMASADGNRLWPGRLVAADRTALTMLVVDDGSRASRAERRALLEAVRAAAAPAIAGGIAVNVVGQDAIRFEIADSVKDDILLFTGGGTAVAWLLALWWFRNWRLALLAFLPAAVAVAWVLGLAAWLGQPIGVTINLVPVLLIVMAFSDGMHLVHAMRVAPVATRDDIPPLIRRIIADIGPACALTSLTTAFALAAFAFTGYGSLVELAVVGGAGTLIAFVAVITLLPAVGPLLARPCDLGQDVGEAGYGFRLSALMIGFVTRHPWPIVLAGTGLLVGGLAGNILAEPSFSTYENIPERSATMAASLDVEDRFGGFFSVWANLPDEAPDAGWARLRRLHEAAEATGATVVSPLTVARAAGHPETPPDAEELARVPDWFTRRFGGPPGSTLRVAAFVGDPNRDAASMARFDALETAAAEAGIRFAGTPMLVRHDGYRLIDRLGLALAVAGFGSIGLIMLGLGSTRIAFAVTLANVTPDLMTGFTLHLFQGGRITVAAGLAMTIAFGIAIDDTIHVLNHIQRRIAGGTPPRDAVITTVGHMSPILGATTIILIGGLSLTLFSDFHSVRSFGELTILVLAFAVFGDLLILPATLLVDRKWLRQ